MTDFGQSSRLRPPGQITAPAAGAGGFATGIGQAVQQNIAAKRDALKFAAGAAVQGKEAAAGRRHALDIARARAGGPSDNFFNKNPDFVFRLTKPRMDRLTRQDTEIGRRIGKSEETGQEVPADLLEQRRRVRAQIDSVETSTEQLGSLVPDLARTDPKTAAAVSRLLSGTNLSLDPQGVSLDTYNRFVANMTGAKIRKDGSLDFSTATKLEGADPQLVQLASNAVRGLYVFEPLTPEQLKAQGQVVTFAARRDNAIAAGNALKREGGTPSLNDVRGLGQVLQPDIEDIFRSEFLFGQTNKKAGVANAFQEAVKLMARAIRDAGIPESSGQLVPGGQAIDTATRRAQEFLEPTRQSFLRDAQAFDERRVQVVNEVGLQGASLERILGEIGKTPDQIGVGEVGVAAEGLAGGETVPGVVPTPSPTTLRAPGPLAPIVPGPPSLRAPLTAPPVRTPTVLPPVGDQVSVLPPEFTAQAPPAGVPDLTLSMPDKTRALVTALSGGAFLDADQRALMGDLTEGLPGVEELRPEDLLPFSTFRS